MDQSLNPEQFKQKIVSKYPDGISSDGRKYSDMDATELTKKVVSQHPGGVTSEGHKYSDYLGTPQKSSLLDSAYNVGTKVSDFIGGKGVADYVGAKIAKSRLPQEQKQYVSEPSTGEVVGSALQVGSMLLPVGTAARGIGLGAKALGIGAKTAGVIGSLIAGAGAGAMYDYGNKLQTGQDSHSGAIMGGAIPLAGPIIKGVTKVAGRVGGEILGKTTGAGYGAIKTGYEAAKAGGQKAESFVSALRGKTSPQSIVDEAQGGLATIKQARRVNYQQQLSDIAGNKTNLDVTPIRKAIDDNLKKFNVTLAQDGSLDFSRSPLRFNNQAQGDITNIVNTMKDFGTREGDNIATGVDSLKKAFSDLYTPSGQARAFVQSVKNSTDNVLSKVPGYNKLAGDYAQKSDLIDEVSRGLSLGDKVSTDTSFKKLTSALRQNNDFRKQLVDELDKASGGYLSSKIAGQQLNPIIPRGLSGVAAGLGGAGSVAFGSIVPLIKVLAVTSPRLVGELTNALGVSARKGKILTDFLTNNGSKFNAPGDYLLGKKIGGKTEQNIASYIKEPKLGLGIKKVSNAPVTVEDNIANNIGDLIDVAEGSLKTMNEAGYLSEIRDKVSKKGSKLTDAEKRLYNVTAKGLGRPDLMSK